MIGESVNEPCRARVSYVLVPGYGGPALRANVKPTSGVIYPAAAHAQIGVKQSGPSVCLSVCFSVNNKKFKCVLNARHTASKEHVDKENRTYFTSIMPQDDQYGSIPCRSNL